MQDATNDAELNRIFGEDEGFDASTVGLIRCMLQLEQALDALQQWVDSEELCCRAGLDLSLLRKVAHRYIRALASERDGDQYKTPGQVFCRPQRELYSAYARAQRRLREQRKAKEAAE